MPRGRRRVPIPRPKFRPRPRPEPREPLPPAPVTSPEPPAPLPPESEPRERPEPEERWYLDPREEQQIIREAARLRAEREPTRPPGLAAPIPTPPAPGVVPEQRRIIERIERAEGRLEPGVPTPRVPEFPLYEPGYMGISDEEGRPLSYADIAEMYAEERRPVPFARIPREWYPPPPEAEILAKRKGPAEAAREYLGRLAEHWRPLTAEEIGPITGEPVTVTRLGGPWAERREETYRPTSLPALWQTLRTTEGGAIGLGRVIMGGIEAVADIGLTLLMNAAYIPERIIGEVSFRNLMTPEKLATEYERLKAVDVRGLAVLTPEIEAQRDAEFEERLKTHTELYNRINDPEPSPELRDHLIREVSRMAYSQPESQAAAWDRMRAGDEPDQVVAEEMDPVPEMVGQIILDPLNVIAPAMAYWKNARTAKRLIGFWKNPVTREPKFFSLIGESKTLAERLNPFRHTRQALSYKASDTVGYAVTALARNYADDPVALATLVSKLGEDDGIRILAKTVGADVDSEAMTVIRRVMAEAELDEMDSLKQMVKPSQLALEPGAEGQAFNAGDFLAELQGRVMRTADEMWQVGLDDPSKGNIAARLAQSYKGELSDVYLGLNPGYMWRNFYNNFATMTVDSLIDLPSLRPGARAAFQARWFEEVGKPPGWDIGWAGRAEVGVTKAGRVVTEEAAPWWNPFKRLAQKGHFVAATVEETSHDIARTKVLRDWWHIFWQGGGDDSFGATAVRALDNYAPDLDPFVKQEVIAAARQSMNDGKFVSRVDRLYESFRRPIGGAAAAVGEPWQGPAFRAGEFSAPRGVSAADVVRYEVEEIGNDIAFDMARIGELEDVPSERLVWVTGSQEDALRYGADVSRVEIGPGSTVIARDREGGYLILKAQAGTHSPSVTRFVPEQARPRPGIITEAQKAVDELAETSDVAQFRHRMSGLIEDLRAERIDAQVRDGLALDPETGAQIPITGVAPEAMPSPDLPPQLHWWWTEARRLEKSLNLRIDDARQMYAQAVSDIRGVPRAEIAAYGIEDLTKPITWRHLGEEERWLYMQRLCDEAVERGIGLDDAQKAFHAQERFVQHFRLITDPPEGPLSVDILQRKAKEFRDLAQSRGMRHIESNEELGSLVRLNPEEARQLGDLMHQYGWVKPSLDRPGFREIQFLELPDEIDQIKLLEGQLDTLAAKRQVAGGVLPPGEDKLAAMIEEKIANLRGEEFDMPVISSMVSPKDEADEILRAIDEAVGPELTEERMLAEMTIDEIDEWLGETAGRQMDAVQNVARIEEEFEKLPEYHWSVRHWNGFEQDVLLEPRTRKPSYVWGGRQFENTQWDRKLEQLRGLYPDYYDEIKSTLSRQGGYEVGDEAVMGEAVRRRMRYRSRLEIAKGTSERLYREVDDLYTARLGREAAEETARLRELGPPAFEPGEMLEAPPEAVARGAGSAEDIWRRASAAQEEVLRSTQADMEALQPVWERPLQSELQSFVVDDDIATVDSIRRGVLGAEGTPPRVPPGTRFGDDDYANIMRWREDSLNPNRNACKIAGEMNAKALADDALLDYRMRRNFDLWAAMVFPYHYWYTRSAVNWTKRMVTRPWAFNTVRRVRNTLQAVNKDVPTRLRDQLGVDVGDKLPEPWMGDTIHLNLIRPLFGPANVFPFSHAFEYDWDDPLEAQNALEELGGIFDTLGMRPFPWIDYPRIAMSGESEQMYYAMPMTAGIKGTTAIMRQLGIGEDVIPPGGLNIEEPIREALGMPGAYFTEETYWPAQHLAMMVAEGEIEEGQAWFALEQALVKGNETDLWNRAKDRGAVQRGVSQVGSYFAGIPLNIYPSGERLLRKWSAQLDELGYAPERLWGGAAERAEFWEERPPMAMRSAIFAFLGPKPWLYKRPDGTTDVQSYKQAVKDFEEAGGGAAELERRYRMRLYGMERGDMLALKAETENKLVATGVGPGTRGWRIWDDWFRENIQEPLYDRYEEYFMAGAGEPPYKASPQERIDWIREQEARELASAYYDIEPEQFADEEGEINWRMFYEARDAALDALPQRDRMLVQQHIHRSRIPEEEAMAIVEGEAYSPLMDLIVQMAETEDETEKAALQEQVDDLKAGLEEYVGGVLAGRAAEIMALHPDWTEEDLARFLGYDVPDFETWQRRTKGPRAAFEQAFKSFYWGLDKGTRRILRDRRWAEQAGVPESYMGPGFAAYVKADPRLQNLGEISDEQLLDWMAGLGTLAGLAEEGFPIPGREIPAGLRGIPGYEARVAGEEPEISFEGVTGRAGAVLRPTGIERFIPGRGPPPVERAVPTAAEPEEPETRTEMLAQQMKDAAADLAVAGEERAEIELAEPTFQEPTTDAQAEMQQAYAELDAWYATPEGERGEWTDLMTKWFSDPNSPKSKWWEAYGQWRAPEENNPMGWGLLPRLLKDDPVIGLLFDSLETGEDLDGEVYLQALETLNAFVEEYGEELVQAKEEFIGYLALLEPEMEELQDEYFSYPQGSDERRELYPRLEGYWQKKREYKENHPLMVRFYFPEYEAGTTAAAGTYAPRAYIRGWRGWRGGGGGRAGAAAQRPPWMIPMRQRAIIMEPEYARAQRQRRFPPAPRRVRYLRT